MSWLLNTVQGFFSNRIHTEVEWLRSTNFPRMLETVRGKAGQRKLRLFVVARYRQTWTRSNDETTEIVALSERYCEGRATAQELESARRRAVDQVNYWYSRSHSDSGGFSSEEEVERRQATREDWRRWCMALKTVLPDPMALLSNPPEGVPEVIDTAVNRCDLLRHIMGNPFRPLPAFTPSATVTALAGALVNGADCRLPFSDALEEAGQDALAEHFRQEAWHPRGCWILDAVLGKQ